MVFGGRDVVFRLVKPDTGRTLFDRSKILQFFRIYFEVPDVGCNAATAKVIPYLDILLGSF